MKGYPKSWKRKKCVQCAALSKSSSLYLVFAAARLAIIPSVCVRVCGLLGLQLCVEGYGLLGTRCKPCASSKYLELTKAGIIVVIIVSIFASCVALGRTSLGSIFSLVLRSHSISFTRAQGIPKHKIGLGLGTA